MDAALQADFGCACGGGFYGATRYFPEVEVVSGAAQIRGAASFRERTKATVIQADVGVIDVAVDDIGDRVADGFLT